MTSATISASFRQCLVFAQLERIAYPFVLAVSKLQHIAVNWHFIPTGGESPIITPLPDGLRYLPLYLDARQQAELVDVIRDIVREAPLYQPAMPRTGTLMSVRMTNCGTLGWVTDKVGGYRYQSTHPATGRQWPAMPEQLLAIWSDVSGWPAPPEAGLINYYDAQARMGLHQDRDEDDLAAPVVSLSLGDDCLFRVGSTARGGPTTGLRLSSGDCVVLQGPSRLAFHGVSKIRPGTSMLLDQPGRINITLRRVTVSGKR
jgi:alkylated DNA repair protein (DNA oxidative demethylase)